jgi:hypothetical protein
MDERDYKSMNKIKTVRVFGVELTPIQEMKFSQFLQRPNAIAMNTLTRLQRYELTKQWLNNELLDKTLIKQFK